MNIAVALVRHSLPGLASNLTSNLVNEFEKKKISGKEAVGTWKGFTLFVSNEDMNDFIKIIKWLEDLGVLIDGVTERVKHETKKQEERFLGALFALLAVSLVQPVISSKGITGRGVRGAGKGSMNIFSSAPSFKQYLDY